MSKSFELLIGAKKDPASIKSLQDDLKVIANSLEPVEIAKVKISNSAIRGIQSQLESAIGKLNINVGLGEGFSGSSKNISNKFANLLKDYKSTLNSKDYLGSLEKLNLPSDKVNAFTDALKKARDAFNGVTDFDKIDTSKATELVDIYKDLERVFKEIKAMGPIGDPVTQATKNKFQGLEKFLNQGGDDYFEAMLRKEGVTGYKAQEVISDIQSLRGQVMTIDVDNATNAEINNLLSQLDSIKSKIDRLKKEKVAVENHVIYVNC